jgi:hypothetical protein
MPRRNTTTKPVEHCINWLTITSAPLTSHFLEASAAMPSRRLAFLAVTVLAVASTGRSEDKPWTNLIGSDGLAAWNAKGDWQEVGDVTLDPVNAKRLAPKPGKGVLWNGPNGRSPDMLSKAPYGDVELHVEFLIPQKSNSGVKFNGQYEVQILDSFGVEKPKGSDCGGIYPRAELKPYYHYLDAGTPPRLNAAKPAGEWQALDMIFVSPRFDAGGKKTANARFVKVVLNGKLIHENVDQATPTGHAWPNKEMPTGPILLQGDHGPVAFRNIRVRSYIPDRGKD